MAPTVTKLTLTDWSDRACKTSAGAAVINHKIRDTFKKRLQKDIMYTDYEWRMLADLCGFGSDWKGWK